MKFLFAKIKIPILFTLLVLLSIACNQTEQKPYLFKIDDYKVYPDEFEYRYNFNPHLTQYPDEKVAKSIVFSSLIAEKVLFLEGRQDAQVVERIKEQIYHHKREAIIEQLRRDSVENLVSVSKQEVLAEFEKAIREVDIKFVAFKSLTDAQHAKQEIDAGKTYEIVIRRYMKLNGWADQSIPTKTIQWSTEPHHVEQIVYSLSKGEVSDPVSIKGDYFLIQVERVGKVTDETAEEYAARELALESRIRSRKIETRYKKFFAHQLKSRLAQVDWKSVHAILDHAVKSIDFQKSIEQDPQLQSQKSLPDHIYQSSSDYLNKNGKLKVVEFPDGSRWDNRELISHLTHGPYAYNFSEENAFRRTFARNIQLALEHEAIYTLACELGYETKDEVVEEKQMWESFYVANGLRHQLLSEIDDTEEAITEVKEKLSTLQLTRLQTMDAYLTKLINKYDIIINKTVYESLELKRTDMVLMKSHYAHRMVAPLLEPLVGLPEWKNIVSEILIENGIT